MLTRGSLCVVSPPEYWPSGQIDFYGGWTDAASGDPYVWSAERGDVMLLLDFATSDGEEGAAVLDSQGRVGWTWAVALKEVP